MTVGPDQVDLCNYKTPNSLRFLSESGKDVFTRALFDADTGEFSFASNDIKTFGSQTIVFRISGNSGEMSESFTFEINLIDPCEVSTITIDPDIIGNISYNVHQMNSVNTTTLNTSLISLSHDTPLCPLELNIINDDGGELNEAVFEFN